MARSNENRDELNVHSSPAASPFIKQLTSSDRTTRDKALSALRMYIRRSKPFANMECAKLWKALFYCMWMSDKPRNQQNLAHELADLVDAISTSANLIGFLDAFWKTMAREWGTIDALRMDKYLFLVRCLVKKGFELHAQNDWQDLNALKEYLQILESTPLEPLDHRIPNGLRYHVIDVYVDELDLVDVNRHAPLETVLMPLRNLSRQTPTKSVKARADEALQDERLRSWTTAGSGAKVVVPSDEEDDFAGFDD